MNHTAPLWIIRFTSSPLTSAARGSERAASAPIVDFPAPGMPDTITHPESSAGVTDGDARGGVRRLQASCQKRRYTIPDRGFGVKNVVFCGMRAPSSAAARVCATDTGLQRIAAVAAPLSTWAATPAASCQ